MFSIIVVSPVEIVFNNNYYEMEFSANSIAININQFKREIVRL